MMKQFVSYVEMKNTSQRTQDDCEFKDESATVGITVQHNITHSTLTGVQIFLSPAGGRNV